MGEVAALTAAFDTEFNKNLQALPAISACPPSEHDAHLNHYRIVQRIAELVAYYASRLPHYISLQRILTFGDRLVKLGEHKLAIDACYSWVKQQNIHQQAAVPRLDEQTRLGFHVQACYGAATCEAALALLIDPQLKHPDTLQALVSCLHQLKDALSLVLPYEALYWLTLNGTLHIYTLAKRMLTSGFVAQMLPFLVFCVKSLESHVIFSTAKYLPWRTQLYITLCYAYCDVHAYDVSKGVVQEGLDKIDALIKLQKLDPVPAAAEVQAAYRTAKAMLCALRLKLEVLSGPTQGAPAAAPAQPAGGDKKGGAAAAAPDKKAAAAAAAAQDASMAALQPLLSAVAVTPKAKLTAMLEALQVPGRRVIRHEPVQGMLSDMFEAVMKEAKPVMDRLKEQLATHQQTCGAGGDKASEAAAGPPDAGESTTPADGGPGGDGASQHAGAASTQGGDHDSCVGAGFNPPEAEDFSLLLHRILLCTAFNFEKPAAFQEAAELAGQRLAMGAVGAADEGQVAVFSAVYHILTSLTQLQTTPGSDSLRHTSSALLEACPAAARAVPDLLTDASLVLHSAARPLIEGVFCARDKEAPLVVEILRTLHAAWESVNLDDPLLRVTSCLKLALLLEEQAAMELQAKGAASGAGSHLLYEARAVLERARTAVTRARLMYSLVGKGAPNEHLRWITGSRSQPRDDTAALVKGMPDTDQELACVHVDVLAALYRVELAVGVAEQTATALSKQAKLQDSVERREAQSNIFGVRTMKERRLDDARITAAAATPSNPPLKERELLQACGKNMYEKALALIQMGPLKCEPHHQVAALTEAADLLDKAQQQEDDLFVSAQPELKGKTSVPLQPKILQRTPTSCTLTNFPISLKGGKKPARYAVYAKSYGAGVALILNKTATEYPGTGVMVVPGKSVTVEGLRTNDTYVFAIAAYDESGQLLGGLGASSQEVLAGLPLPIYYCWAHLCLMACKLHLWPIAKRAAHVLFPQFIITSPDRPLWEANPMDAQVLSRQHLEMAAAPLLRGFVQAVYAYTGAVLAQEMAAVRLKAAGGVQRGTGPPLAEVRVPYLEEQVARLKSVRRLLLASEVAVVLHDEMLIQEGCVRVYHLLGPLLAVKEKSSLLHKALSSVYIALTGVSNLIQDSQVGQELQRMAAARVAAATTYHAESLAARAAETSAAQYFARLQADVLKAYDPKFSIPGRPAAKEALPEVSQLQDSLLGSGHAGDGTVLADRRRDESDLVAAVLPLLSGRGAASPLDAWASHLGKEEATEHPRWVELVVRMLEACVRCGKLENVAAIAQQLLWHVRTSLARPMVDFPGAKWSLEAAAAEQAGVTLAPHDEPPRPQVEGLPKEEADALLEAWAADKEAALLQARRRLAAVLLLQRRLPVLMARRRTILSTRAKTRTWAPWLARLHALLGLMAAGEGRVWVAHKLRAQKEAADRPAEAVSAGGGAAPGGGSRPGSRPTSPSPEAKAKGTPKKEEADKGKAKGGKKGADANADVTPPTPPPPPPLIALHHLAQAMQLACRHERWHEGLNAVRHMWNTVRALLNMDPSLMTATHRCEWQKGQMPPRPAPPAESLIAPAGAKDGKGGAKATPRKDDPKAKAGDKGKGGKAGKGVVEAPTHTVFTWPDIWLPVGVPRGDKDKAAEAASHDAAVAAVTAAAAQVGFLSPRGGAAAQPQPTVIPNLAAVPNTARSVRAAIEAVLGLVAAVQAGASLSTGVIAMVPGADGEAGGDSGSVRGGGRAGGTERPGTQASAAYASSNFSYGSDLLKEMWFETGQLDMAWINKFMVTGLMVLYKMNRFHAVLELGKSWLSLCEGAFNETVLPILLATGPLIDADISHLTQAMEVVVRDKNQALDQLDKVRKLVRERLGDVTPLNQPMGMKMKKKRRVAPGAAGLRRQGSMDGRSGAPGDDTASLVSMYTYRTHASSHSRGSQPDFIKIPAEYEKAIETLKKRGEKGAMILAISELGDVHAHFGNWSGAMGAWGDALDTLIGPYQVVKNWRKALDGRSREQVLNQYGMHGCLLAGGILLGKLARYAYFSHLGLRLEVARMSSVLLGAMFCCSSAHPQRQAGFATYVPRELWEGVDLLSDPYRVNMTDLLSGVETIAVVLVDSGLALEALPVISLWEHVALYVTRSVNATLMCRIQRARALIHLGLLAEASSVVIGLMQGAALPDATLDTHLVLRSEEDGSPLVLPPVAPLSGRLMPGDPANKACITLVAQGPVPGPVERLYGPWVVAHLALVRAGLLMRLGGMPNLWAAAHPATGRRVTPEQPLPEPVEASLLEHAAALIQRATAMAEGRPLEPEAGPKDVSGAGKPGAGGGKDAAKKPGTPPGGAKRGDDKKIASAPSAAPPESDMDGPAAGRGSSPLADAQRTEVQVRALLASSVLEQLRWQPAAGLAAALGALKALGQRGVDGSLNLPLGDNDDTSRYSVSASLWLEARLQAVTCLSELRHTGPCFALVQTGLREAGEVADARTAAALLHVQAQLQDIAGQTADAVNTYTEVIARLQALHIQGLPLATALVDAALLRERLGLYDDAASLGESACRVLASWTCDLGLNEAKESPELVNLYMQGLNTYVSALSLAARCAKRGGDVRLAVSHLTHAVTLLRNHTRALPTAHADVLLALGRKLRLLGGAGGVPRGRLGRGFMSSTQGPMSARSVGGSSSAPGSSGSPSNHGKEGAQPSSPNRQAAAVASTEDGSIAGDSGAGGATSSVTDQADFLARAVDVLTQALTLSALDGGQRHFTMRCALLELAVVALKQEQPTRVAACLKSAHLVAVKADALLVSGHTLAPVSVAGVPGWALEYVRGQEAAFAVSQGRDPPSTLPDPDLGRMVMCHFISLHKSLLSLPMAQRERSAAHMVSLHTALRTACPKYASEICFPDAPLPPAPEAAPPLTPGYLIVQWYCLVDEEAGGTLGGSGSAEDAAILAIQPALTNATMIYAFMTQAGQARCGSLTVEVPGVRALQRHVKELRHRTEFPKAPTDILGQEAPSRAELAQLRAAVERFLGGRGRGSEDGTGAGGLGGDGGVTLGGAVELDSPPPTPPPAAAPTSAKGKKGGDRDAAAAAGGGQPVVPPPTDLSFLIKVEAMLSLESGLEVVDAPFAAFLAQSLPA